MGRTIPSFRQLLEIEKFGWSDFRKSLPTKKHRKAFDEIYKNAKSCTSYLSNAVNPIVIECVMMGHLFRNYKASLGLPKKETKSMKV